MPSYMTVNVSNGLFPSERVIEFEAWDELRSMFVYVGQVDLDAKRVRVTVLDRDDAFALVLVGTSVVKVPNRALADV